MTQLPSRNGALTIDYGPEASIVVSYRGFARSSMKGVQALFEELQGPGSFQRLTDNGTCSGTPQTEWRCTVLHRHWNEVVYGGH